MREKILFLIGVIAAFLLIASVNASVSQIDRAYYGIIEDNDYLNTTQILIGNFNVIGFTCGDKNCSNIEGSLWNGSILSSQGNTQISLVYPTILQNQGYGIYLYKQDYFPYEIEANWAGNGQAPTEKVYLTKKAICSIQISNLTVQSNNTVAEIEAIVNSPVQKEGPLDYIPSNLLSYYSVNGKINFTFYNGNYSFSIIKNMDLPASQQVAVNFSVPLSSGYYNLTVGTSTSDSKCLNYQPLQYNQTFSIINGASLPFLQIESPNNSTYGNAAILVNISTTNSDNTWFVWNGNEYDYSQPFYFSFNQGSNNITAYANNSFGETNQTVYFNINQNNSVVGTISNLVMVNRGTNFIYWTWNNPNDINFNNTIIYLNGINLANTSNNFYNAAGLSENTVYTITINTEGKNGNINNTNVSDSEYTLENGNGGGTYYYQNNINSAARFNNSGGNYLPPLNYQENNYTSNQEIASSGSNYANNGLWYLMGFLIMGILLVALLILLMMNK